MFFNKGLIVSVKVLLCFAVMCAGLGMSTYAQHEISVCVIDENTGEAVPEAYVQIVANGESQGVFVADNSLCTVATGIEDLHQSQITGFRVSHAYPNPTSGIAHVQVASPLASQVHYTLFDILGRKISTGHTTGSERSAHLRFDLSNEAPGIYLARITDGQQVYTVKMVKQHGASSSSDRVDFLAVAPSFSPGISNPSQLSSTDSTQVYVSVLATDSTGVKMGPYYSRRTTHLIDRDTTLTISVAPVPESPCDSSEIFMIVAQMPQLVGGLASIGDLIHFPQEAINQGVEGRTFVQFVVDKKGRVVDGVIVRGIGAGTDEEALRATQLAEFLPGMQSGEAVCVRMSLPITFRLSD